jgi:hypothetical protein
MIEWLLALLFGTWLGAAKPATPAAAAPQQAGTAAAPHGAKHGELDRIAAAVEGAESSHGRDRLMWKPNLPGPQGPMQVTLAASRDVGSTDRFDMAANRQIGRDYLAALFHRYGNWPDTVAAYNWGPGNLERWIAAGRPPAAMAAPIQSYIERVLHEFRGTAGGGAAAIGEMLAVPAVSAPSPQIRDPALRQAYERNTAAIKGISDFIAGDTAAEGAVRGALQQVAQRPGYGEFRRLRVSDQHRASPAALRQIAEVLRSKLQSENAAIVLIDERRHGKLR